MEYHAGSETLINNIQTLALKAKRKMAQDFITSRLDYPLNAPYEQWESKEFCLTAITLKNNALRCVPRKFWRDQDFCLNAVKRNAKSLERIRNDIMTEEMCYIAVKQDAHALGNVPNHLLSEPLIMEATAVRFNI